MSFNTTEYIVFLIGICISLGVGIFYAFKDRNKTTLHRYHRGDSKLNAVSVAISLLVTKESSIFFLGAPAEVYTHGIQYFVSAFAKAIGYTCIISVAIPLFHPLGITSLYEYLERRHGSTLLSRLGAIIDMVLVVLYSAIILFGASIALKTVTSIDVWVLAIGLATIAVIYTSLGGIKAVVFADVIQCFAMAVPMLTILIYGTVHVGGVGNVIRLNLASGRLKPFNFDPDPLVRNSFWALLIGSITGGFVEICSQTTVQRLNSTHSIKDARTVMFIFLPGFVLIELLGMAEGLVAFAYFSNKGCDPLASGQISNPNQIMPITVDDMLSPLPGAAGLFFAGLVSASLSTLSSQFSSMSAVATMELANTGYKIFSPTRITRIAKLLVILVACICVVTALVFANVPGPLTQISDTVVTSTFGALGGIFVLSIFTKCSVKGISVGAVAGVIFGAWISAGSNFSSGTKRTPWLPLGPTTSCPGIPHRHITNLFSNISDVFINNSSLTSGSVENVTIVHLLNVSEMSTEKATEETITGLNRLYSISFHYFSTIIILITVIVGKAASTVLKDTRDDIPANLILPVTSIVRCFSSPRCLRREKIVPPSDDSIHKEVENML